MAVTKMISSKSSHNLIHYIMDGEAHDKTYTTSRNLFLGGHNVFGDYQGKANAEYISCQFYAVRKMAGKSKKKTQAFHNIYSFSDDEFPATTDKKELQAQAEQAYKLVNSFLQTQLPKDSQYLIGIQRDGTGGKLHAHVAINSVLTSGKVLNTNNLSLVRKILYVDKKKTVSKGLFQCLQDYMTDNFETVTGRKYQQIQRDESNLVTAKEQQLESRGAYIWKEDLKDRIIKSAQSSTSLETFKQTLKDVYGVEVTERTASTGKVDANGKKIKRLGYTYSFVGDDGKKYRSRDYYATKKGVIRGLGKFTRPQDLEPILEANLERQQEEEELKELEQVSEQVNVDLQKVEVIDSGKTRKSVQQQQTNTTEQQPEPEPEPVYKGDRVKAVTVKKINVKRSDITDYDTSFYDQHTQQLQQQTLQEATRRQRLANAKAERERKKREQQYKQQQLELEQSNQPDQQQLQDQQRQVDRYQEPANNTQGQKYPDTKQSGDTRQVTRDDGPDPW